MSDTAITASIEALCANIEPSLLVSVLKGELSTARIELAAALPRLATVTSERDALEACLQSACEEFDPQPQYGELAGRIEEIKAKLEAAERDAQRYRWLRNGDNYPSDDWWGRSLDTASTPERMDAAIDAAMKADQ